MPKVRPSKQTNKKISFSTIGDTNCHVETTLKIIGGKWKPVILWHLSKATLRFSELEKKIPDISQKMLTQSLKELEQDRLINRKAFPVIPPKVEYSITRHGISLNRVLKELDQWGQKHQDLFHAD